ncbi:F-box/kelch-repeat protein At3g06240-like [Papaver somniferum]|uniref:F-box/kelch-repeat protein At3g06240-like n=1 Tax=Papaver somniferum TaxID=3469 RepID=UPI000E6FDD8A|nr:F-box/kelch-repeat protein At3g06240-like [Papaver somniferum]
MVYSLKKNKWKAAEELHLDNLDHRKIPDMARMPVNGALHWIADMEFMTLPSEDSEVILSFDIESEQVDHLKLPDLFNENAETSLCVLGGSLCLLGFDPKVGADVWEMKQDGAEKSWTKLFTIDLQKHFGGLAKNLMPLQCLKDGNILSGLDMDTGFQIVLYDPKHNTTSIVKVHEGLKNGCLHISVFGESQWIVDDCQKSTGVFFQLESMAVVDIAMGAVVSA